MDEKLINKYVNILANKVSELNLENLLLKSKLTLANEIIDEYQKQEEVDGDNNKTKAK